MLKTGELSENLQVPDKITYSTPNLPSCGFKNTGRQSYTSRQKVGKLLSRELTSL